jgi:exodeoxyribonuclease-3
MTCSDYEAVWKGQKSWNGVAILASGAAPIVTESGTRLSPPGKNART